jgi:hypothetical protein
MAANQQAKRKAILTSLQHGNTRRAACAAAGIHWDTFYQWLKDDPTFSDAVAEKEAAAEIEAVSLIRNAAEGGAWQAAAWWLERRRHDDWKKGDELDVRKLSVEQLLVLAERGNKGAESTGDRMASSAGGDAEGRDSILPTDPTAETETVP